VIHMRLGEVLAEAGVLTPEQIQRVLDVQRDTHEPFGLISERLFDVPPARIEEAWATQYAAMTRRLDPAVESFCDRALAMVTRRQAWQFRVLPVRFDGQELLLATTRRHLRRALRFVTNVLGVPAYLVLAEPRALGEALCKRFPMQGMTAGSVDDDSLERLARR
jgi:hypothetical protein